LWCNIIQKLLEKRAVDNPLNLYQDNHSKYASPTQWVNQANQLIMFWEIQIKNKPPEKMVYFYLGKVNIY